MTLTYQQVQTPTEDQNALLLLADPSQRLVAAYISKSHVYAANDRSGLVGMLVLQPRSQQVVEIMNVVVTPPKQHQGYGRVLLMFAQQWAIDRSYRTVRIATGTTSLVQLYLYQQCGFRVVAVERDYFTANYSQPIVENGLVLQDRLVLELPITLPQLPINEQ
ncbi:GNAT family N-acetyltransferase [Levilactobacillus yonginensis]|uniref:GNAT family N-acetyltransferase n=1 Tax=Levilactobacillus yonginensis TaxID=1054041 RepID=UPI00345CA215